MECNELNTLHKIQLIIIIIGITSVSILVYVDQAYASHCEDFQSKDDNDGPCMEQVGHIDEIKIPEPVDGKITNSTSCGDGTTFTDGICQVDKTVSPDKTNGKWGTPVDPYDNDLNLQIAADKVYIVEESFAGGSGTAVFHDSGFTLELIVGAVIIAIISFVVLFCKLKH